MATVATKSPAAKFRKLAESLPSRVEYLRRPMTQNSTPKRQREYMGRCIDADNLERGRLALLVLADSWDRGDVPDILRTVTTKDEVCRLVRHGIGSNGYYNVYPDGQYRDKSDAGLALQILLEASLSQQTQEQQAEIAKRREIERLIDRVRFSPIPGFFPTPEPVIRTMLDFADVREGQSVLEPSAGIGSICDLLAPLGASITCCERQFSLVEILKAKGYETESRDFIEWLTERRFDRVLMNPPFENLQDIDHIQKAHGLLADGGRLVSVVSSGPFFRSDKKSLSFREWVGRIGADVIDLAEGSFRSAFRSTGIPCKLLIADAHAA